MNEGEIGEGYEEPKLWMSEWDHNIEATDEYWDARHQEWRPFGMLLAKRPYWFFFAEGLGCAGGKIRRRVVVAV